MTFAEVQTLFSSRRAVLALMHTEMGIDENYYLWSAEFAKARWLAVNGSRGFPETYIPRLLSLAYMGVQRALNNTLVGETLDVTPSLPDDWPRTGTEAEKAKKRADTVRLIRSWCRAAAYTIDTFSAESPFRDFFCKLYELGLGVFSYRMDLAGYDDPPFGWLNESDPAKKRVAPGRTAEDKKKLKQWQAQRRQTFPWRVESLHPMTVLFDTDHDPPQDFIIWERLRAETVTRYYPDLEELSEVQPSGDGGVDRLTYVSQTEYGYWVRGRPVLTQAQGADEEGFAPNPYGLWIRLAWSGMGDWDFTRNYAYKGMGLIRNARDVIMAKLTAFNYKQLQIQEAAYGSLLFGGPGAEALRDQWADTTGPSIGLADETGQVKVSALPKTELPRDIWQSEREVDQMLEWAIGPALMEGARSPGETAAGQRMRGNYAAAPYRAPRQNGQQVIAAMYMDFFKNIRETLTDGVTCQGITLKPEHLPEGTTVMVDIAPLTEEDKAFKKQGMRDDLKAGLITEEDYIRETRDGEDSARYLEKIQIEQFTKAILDSPPVLNLGIQRLLEKMGVVAPVPPGGAGVPAGPAGASGGEPPPAPPAPPSPTLGSPADAADRAVVPTTAVMAGMPGTSR